MSNELSNKTVTYLLGEISGMLENMQNSLHAEIAETRDSLQSSLRAEIAETDRKSTRLNSSHRT